MTNQEKAVRSELENGHPVHGFGVNYLVEAGAGAGKTYTMIRRMVNQLVSGSCAPEHMVAITFTVKSTQEMRNRLDEQLRERRKQAADPEQAQRLEELIRAAGQMQISTIHGFCQTLLETMPFQSPFGVEMNVMEDDRAVCRAFFKRSFWADPAVFDTVRSRFRLRYSDLEDTFADCCHNGEIEVAYAPLNSADYQQAEDELCRRVTQLQEKLHTHLSAIGGDWAFFDPELAGLLQMTPAAFAADPAARDTLAWMRRHRDKLEVYGEDDEAEQFNRWLKYTKAQREAAALADPGYVKAHPLLGLWEDARRLWEGKDKANKKNPSRENELRIRYMKDAMARVIHSLTMEVLLPLTARYRAEKQARGIATYDDLLLRARDMLRDNEAARSFFHDKYRVLYVDEFQDTDPVQAELLFYLTAQPDTVNPTNWHSCRPVPGSLFLVGDPKQAIYRFRGADIDVYNAVKGVFSAGGGTVCQLNANFRSAQLICQCTDLLFSPPAVLPALGSDDELPRFTRKTDAQGQPEPNYDPRQAEYAEMVAEQTVVPRALAFSYCARREQRFVVQKDADGKVKTDKDGNPKMKNEGGLQDPEQVAAFIRTMVDHQVNVPEKQKGGGVRLRPACWGDFLILTRTKGNIQDYAAALSRLDIPTNVTGEQKLSEVGAVHRTVLHLKAMLETRDDLALIRVLESCYGVELETMRLFLQRTGLSSLRASLSRSHLNGIGHALAGETTPDEKLLHLCSTLEELISLREMPAHMPAMSVLDRLTDGGYGIWNTDGDAQSRSREYARMQQYLDLVRAGGQRSFPALAAHAVACAGQSVKYELALEEEDNQVRIMNLHQAKGLEGNIVILAYSTDGRDNIYRHVDRSGAPREYACVLSRGGVQPSVLGWPDGWNGEQLPGLDSKKQVEKSYLDAEKLRLQYVAVTRAAYWLVVCGWAEKWEQKGSQILRSAVDTGWSRISNDNVLPGLDMLSLQVTDPKLKAALNSLNTGACAYVRQGGAQPAAVCTPRELEQELARRARDCARVGSYAITPSKLDHAARSVSRFPGKLDETDEDTTPTVDTPAAADVTAPAAGPRGADWGTIVHRIMELAVRAEQYESVALERFARQAVEETLPDGVMTAGQHQLLLGQLQPDEPMAYLAVQAAKAAAFLSREDAPLRSLMAGGRSYPELPFHLREGDLDSSLYRHLCAHISDDRAAGKSLDVQGILDLAIHRDSGEWIVVDYKTDALRAGETSDQLKSRLREEYTPQIMSYVKILERLNTGAVAGAYLCSIPLGGELVPLMDAPSGGSNS